MKGKGVGGIWHHLMTSSGRIHTRPSRTGSGMETEGRGIGTAWYFASGPLHVEFVLLLLLVIDILVVIVSLVIAATSFFYAANKFLFPVTFLGRTLFGYGVGKKNHLHAYYLRNGFWSLMAIMFSPYSGARTHWLNWLILTSGSMKTWTAFFTRYSIIFDLKGIENKKRSWFTTELGCISRRSWILFHQLNNTRQDMGIRATDHVTKGPVGCTYWSCGTITLAFHAMGSSPACQFFSYGFAMSSFNGRHTSCPPLDCNRFSTSWKFSNLK